MKRVLLIAGGTMGGLGAVLAITPPQFATSASDLAFPSTGASAATPTATASSVPKSTPPTKAATPTDTTTKSPTATATATPAPSAGVTGKFTGDSVFVKYGNVQVQITVVDGKITDAQAIQAPSGQNDRYTNMSVPVLRERTLVAQSANISGVSGASYTSFGWYTSLVSALAKAKL